MLRAMRQSQIADAKKPLDAWTINADGFSPESSAFLSRRR